MTEDKQPQPSGACQAEAFVFIVHGKRRKRWHAVEKLVKEANVQGCVRFTEAKGHAMQLAQQAHEAWPAATIVAVGGDGLLNEVVNGVMAARAAAGAAAAAQGSVALLPMGTGSDFARSLGWRSCDAVAACARLAAARTRAVNVCRLRCQSDAGLVERWFLNIASAGASGAAARAVSRYRPLGGWLGYNLAAAEGLLRCRRVPARLRLDDGDWTTLRALTVVAVASGQWFGAGMKIAPGADPCSGRAQVVTADGVGLWTFLTRQGLLRRGTHLSLPGFGWHGAATRVRVEAGAGVGGRALPVECDGEPVGYAPLEVEVLPAALRFVV